MFFRYVVKYYDQYEPQTLQDSGIVHAKNYGSAANKVVKFYDESLISDIYLKEIDNADCLNDEAIDYVLKGH